MDKVEATFIILFMVCALVVTGAQGYKIEVLEERIEALEALE